MKAFLLPFSIGVIVTLVTPFVVWCLWLFSERVWLYLTTPAPRVDQMLTSGLGGRVYRVAHVERKWLWWTAEIDPFVVIHHSDGHRLEPDFDANAYTQHLDPRRIRRLKPYIPPEIASILQRAGEAR